ncbi:MULTISPECIES: NfeD family protein [Silvimonas]|uniref:NfeD family protein n=1 Tax=Silvimonas TaxID=300264 RepID=UPI0024B334BF|nr:MULTISPECIES: NfeD family protein [Silvimonas]MDR3426358.1 NfeD family protein [Silvimonas sp.]
MSHISMWFIAALVLAGLEMLSGTLYMLAIACGLAVGGISSLLGISVPAQIIIAAAAAVVAVGLLHNWKARKQIGTPDTVQSQLDLGHRVTIDQWLDDRHARVRYRGTTWDAEIADLGVPQNAPTYFITGQRGNILLIDIIPPANAEILAN